MNIKKELEKRIGVQPRVQLNDVDIDSDKILAIMINEVVPIDNSQDFYGQLEADYLKTTIPLFQKAGINVSNIQDILKLGIYITNAVKIPKTQSTIEKECIKSSLPYLEQELALFPRVKVIMLMGDVAKKSFNMIMKKETKQNIIPSVSTYKLRQNKIYHQGIRIMPSYIMTGKNILIEKSKVEMASADIAEMFKVIQSTKF